MNRILIIAIAALALFATLMSLETMQEGEPITVASFAVELLETGLLVLAIASTAFLAVEVRDFRQQRADLEADLTRAKIDGDRWRAAARVHIDGLGRAIQGQFGAWGLTDSEAEVAMLMLKGLSHKEIARLRHSGETTVRQQARAVYRKSNLSSRAELAAYFLEDLLPPQDRTNQTVTLLKSQDLSA